FEAAPTIAGGAGADTLVIADDAVAVTDAEFAHVSGIETLQVSFENVTLGADASAEIGTGTLLVDAVGEGGAIGGSNVDFSALTAKFAFVGSAEVLEKVTVTADQFESGLSLSAVDDGSHEAAEVGVIAGAATIPDAAFAHV